MTLPNPTPLSQNRLIFVRFLTDKCAISVRKSGQVTDFCFLRGAGLGAGATGPAGRRGRGQRHRYRPLTRPIRSRCPRRARSPPAWTARARPPGARSWPPVPAEWGRGPFGRRRRKGLLTLTLYEEAMCDRGNPCARQKEGRAGREPGPEERDRSIRQRPLAPRRRTVFALTDHRRSADPIHRR